METLRKIPYVTQRCTAQDPFPRPSTPLLRSGRPLSMTSTAKDPTGVKEEEEGISNRGPLTKRGKGGEQRAPQAQEDPPFPWPPSPPPKKKEKGGKNSSPFLLV